MDELKIFIYTHDGIYLRGYSVVIAKDEAEALSLLKELLTNQGLSLDGIELMASFPANEPIAKLIWNGDY